MTTSKTAPSKEQCPRCRTSFSKLQLNDEEAQCTVCGLGYEDGQWDWYNDDPWRGDDISNTEVLDL